MNPVIMVVKQFPSFATVKGVICILCKDGNVMTQFKSSKASEIFGVDRVVSVIWVILSTFHISVL